jgi:hypothetical protein
MICETQGRAQVYCNVTFLIYSWLTDVACITAHTWQLLENDEERQYEQ